MPKITDSALAAKIAATLTKLQEHLIALRQSGRTECQSIVPSVDISHTELRRLTGRIKIKTAFITNLIGLLEDEGLEVDYDAAVEILTITKPAEDIGVEYPSFRDLSAMVTALES